jgi:chromosome segregation ATPase
MGTIESNVDKRMSKLKDELELWGAKLDELAAKVEVAGQEAKIEAKKHLDDVKGKLQEARAKLDEARSGGEDRWDKFKAGIESSWKELERAFHALAH